MKNLREAVMVPFVPLLASAMIACASGTATPSRSAVALGDAVPPEGRKCEIAALPEPLPEVTTIVDVVGLQPALAAELAESSPAGGLLYSIRFAPNGQREWFERIGTEPPDARQVRIQRIIAEHLKNQPPAREPWSLRLQVVPGDPSQIRLGRSQLCPVQPIAEGGPTATGTVVLSAAEMAELRRAGTGRVAVDVSATGTVLRVELLRSTGSRIRDDHGLEAARASRYRPALVDGIPVAARHEIPLRSRVRVR